MLRMLCLLLLGSGVYSINSCQRTASDDQQIRHLLSTDIFLRHLQSGALNPSLRECDNFHRHICPKDGLTVDQSVIGLFNEILAIEKKCLQHDVYTKIQGDFNVADHFDYTNVQQLAARLFSMSKETLVSIYEWTTLISQDPASFHKLMWNKQKWSTTIDTATFPAKYNVGTFSSISKRKNFTRTLATQIVSIITANGGIAAMQQKLSTFLRDITNNMILLNIMHREGIETGITRDRAEPVMLNVAEEYGRVLEAASWSIISDNAGNTRYDRFHDRLLDIYHTSMNSSVGNAGIVGTDKIPSDFYNFYKDARFNTVDLATLPKLRTFLNVWKASEQLLETMFLDLMMRFGIIQTAIPNSLNFEMISLFMKTQAIFDLVTNAAPDSAMYATIGHTYAHELYHQVQTLYGEIMSDSLVVNKSIQCVDEHFERVCARFTGDACFPWFQLEEEADVYGIQIAYGAFVAAIGSDIDTIVYPALNMTHRQLFFYSNSIHGCNINDGTPSLPDAHYEVNGRISQARAFRTTFGCAEGDGMVFPESGQCDIFFREYAY